MERSTRPSRAGAQEPRRRLLPARLLVALVVAMGLWAREGPRDVLKDLVEGLREQRSGLITSLLDPTRYPAATLAAEYHQRWRPSPWPNPHPLGPLN